MTFFAKLIFKRVIQIHCVFYFWQTRSLLGVFEEDAAAISSYINQLYQAMRRIYDAQVKIIAVPLYI